MKLYLGGGETGHAYRALQFAGCEAVSFSYFDMRRKSQKELQHLFESCKEAGRSVIVQSGSYTLRLNDKLTWYDLNENLKERTLRPTPKDDGENFADRLAASFEFIERYQEKYRQFAMKWVDYVDFFVELDLFKIYPSNKIYAWREDWLENELPLCVINPLDWDEDEWTFDEYVSGKYFAIGLREMPRAEDYLKIIKGFSQAFVKNKVRFHGLGISDISIHRRIPFYSADTTAWANGGRFGVLFKFNPPMQLERVLESHHKQSRKDSIKRRLKKKVEDLGIDFTKFAEDDFEALNSWNASQWYKYAQALTTRKKHMEYWREDTAIVRKTDATELSQRPTVEALDFASDPRLSIYRNCDSCIIADSCPLYLEGSDCRLEQPMAVIDNNDGIDKAASIIASIQLDRAVQAVAGEKMQGGMPTEEVSMELDRAMSFVEKYHKMKNPRNGLSIQASGEAGASILGALLAGLGSGPDGKSSSPVSKAARNRRNEQAIRESEKETDAVDAEIIDMD